MHSRCCWLSISRPRKKFNHKINRQHETTKLSVMNPEQETLDLSQKRELVVLDPAVIANQPSTLAAFNLMPNAHGLTDQIICTELPMDKSQWSKVRSGSFHFEMNLYSRLMDICGSEAFLMRLNWERGYDPLPPRRKSQLEQELEAEKEHTKELKRENKVLRSVLNRGGA